MNYPRLIASIVVSNGLHVQSLGFKKYLPIGCPVESAREFDRWGVDEIALVLLDSDSKKNRRLISEVSSSIAVPLSAIGGIRTLTDARAYIAEGADKFGFNKSLVENPDLIKEASTIFGCQCVIASIDLIKGDHTYYRFDYWNKSTSNVPYNFWLNKVEDLGAGEIYLNFPENDGFGKGMELQIIKSVVNETSMPVIAVGGVGTPGHANDCFRIAKPSGIGIGNRLAHFEHSILLFKQGLKNVGAPIRFGVKANYTDTPIDEIGRLRKKDEVFLNDLLFKRIEPEII